MDYSLLNEHLSQYPKRTLGTLIHAHPLLGGTVNTHYLLTTTTGKWVFTILEQMSFPVAHQISRFILFLNEHEFPTPVIQLNHADEAIMLFNNKPSLIVTYLEGQSPLHPTPKHCFQIGMALGKLHLLTQSYVSRFHNPMGNEWRVTLAHQLLPNFNTQDQALIQTILQEQAELPLAQLPQGIIHFDLFRDNTLFLEDKLNGVIDFYYACYDNLILDLSIALNDWCTDWNAKTGYFIEEKFNALKRGYESFRPLTDIENQVLPSMLRISALHFWLTRTHSLILSKTQPNTSKLLKDPNEYKMLLLAR